MVRPRAAPLLQHSFDDGRSLLLGSSGSRLFMELLHGSERIKSWVHADTPKSEIARKLKVDADLVPDELMARLAQHLQTGGMHLAC